MKIQIHIALLLVGPFMAVNAAHATAYNGNETVVENAPVALDNSASASTDDTTYVLSNDLQIQKFDMLDDGDEHMDEQGIPLSEINNIGRAFPGLELDSSELGFNDANGEQNSTVILPAGTRFALVDGIIAEENGEKFVQVQLEGGYRFWSKLAGFDKAEYIAEVQVAGKGKRSAGKSISRAGWRKHPVYGRVKCHEGTDISYPSGTPVGARGGAGTITHAGGGMSGYGKLVEIDHGGGMISRYAHLSSISVRVGQRVGKGQNIGRVGCTGICTGPHLHYEYKKKGTSMCGGKKKRRK